MVDLDRFKNVNDSLGHAAGDALLRQVAVRLRSALRGEDVLARLGGDEFAIIQAGRHDQRANSTDLAGRISKLIAEPFQLPGNQVEIGTSIGIAIAPEHGDDREQLLKKADLALYRSKSAGRNCFTRLRRGDVGRTRGAQYAGRRLARCHRALPVRGSLPAVFRRSDRAQARGRGADPLASSDARA